ncbi:MAG: ribose-phosphate pyrophosphokinase-like domain-containing protein, partial [Spirochaetota bacterium]
MAEQHRRSDESPAPQPAGSSEHGPELRSSGRGELLIAACRSGSVLAEKTVRCYNQRYGRRDGEGSREGRAGGEGPAVRHELNVDRSFSDSETGVRIQSQVSGADVFLFQGLYDPPRATPVDQNYLSFLIAARAFREHGARHVTAVLPYLAYGRQDKPTRFTREPTTARLMADLSSCAGIDRLVTWHPHSQQARGFYGTTPVHM